MKNERMSIVGYTRVSTEDQSNFSLDAQDDAIRRLCIQEGWEVQAIFEDDGQSAKNFDRVNWRALEAFMAKNHKTIDYLVVMKYDRFSRNLGDSLAMIQRLETKWCIKIISVMEPIGIPPESPFFFQLRTQLLLNAHVERLVIKERTKMGMRQAARTGRFLGRAPFGYTNARDGSNKPIIVIDEEKAAVVRDVFDLFIAGVPQAEIARIAAAKGLKQKSKDSIIRLITRPTYAGFIVVPASGDQEEHLVPALHAPIIDEKTWWRAQARINRGNAPRRGLYNESVPLKGLLKCGKCGGPLTASRSKGRGGYYWYYECQGDHMSHRKSIPARIVHERFDALLSELSYTDQQIEYLHTVVKSMIKKNLSANMTRIKSMRAQLRDLQEKIDSLEEKYIKNEIQHAVYKKWAATYSTKKNKIVDQIENLDGPKLKKVWDKYEQELEAMKNIPDLFKRATGAEKSEFFNIGFGSALVFENGIYRTTFLSPLFRAKALILKQKRLLNYQQPGEISGKDPLGEVNGSRTHDLRNHNPTL